MDLHMVPFHSIKVSYIFLTVLCLLHKYVALGHLARKYQSHRKARSKLNEQHHIDVGEIFELNPPVFAELISVIYWLDMLTTRLRGQMLFGICSAKMIVLPPCC